MLLLFRAEGPIERAAIRLITICRSKGFWSAKAKPARSTSYMSICRAVKIPCAGYVRRVMHDEIADAIG